MKGLTIIPLTALYTVLAHEASEDAGFSAFARSHHHYQEDKSIIERRIEQVKDLMGSLVRGSTNDAERFVTIDHESDRTDITPDIDLDKLFQGGTVKLQPEASIGPFYIGGEFLRSDITEGQVGVPLWLSANFYDITTKQPIPNLYFEVWQANATGAYSGLDSPMNAHGDNLLNSTFLRGIVKTDGNGAATFKTIYPGHYEGRSTHIHFAAHTNAREYPNGTIGIGHDGHDQIAHVGQVLFDDKLNKEVNDRLPYSENEIPLEPLNIDDEEVERLSAEGAPDPFCQYVHLGDNLDDGVYAWISIGIDASTAYQPEQAAYLMAEGGDMLADGPATVYEMPYYSEVIRWLKRWSGYIHGMLPSVR